jgi:hypothetical protein
MRKLNELDLTTLKHLTVQADQLCNLLSHTEDAAHDQGDTQAEDRLERLYTRACKRFWRRWNRVLRLDRQAVLY